MSSLKTKQNMKRRFYLSKLRLNFNFIESLILAQDERWRRA